MGEFIFLCESFSLSFFFKCLTPYQQSNKISKNLKQRSWSWFIFGNITFQTDRLFSLCFLNLVVLHQFHKSLLASTGYVTPKVSGSDHWSDGYYEIPLCSHMFWIPDHFPEFSLLLWPSALRNWRMRLEMTFQNEFQLHHNVTVWERAGKLRKGSEIKQTQSDQSLQRGLFHQYQRHIEDLQICTEHTLEIHLQKIFFFNN